MVCIWVLLLLPDAKITYKSPLLMCKILVQLPVFECMLYIYYQEKLYFVYSSILLFVFCELFRLYNLSITYL